MLRNPLVPELNRQTNVPPMPPAMAAAMEQNKVYIFNVGPKQWSRPMGSLGSFIIPACELGERYSKALMYRGSEGLPSIIPETVVKTVEGTTIEMAWNFDTEGKKLAMDIVGFGAFHAEDEDLRPYGVFIAGGPVPTELEIDEANARLNDRYDKLVRAADQMFQVNGGMQTGDNGVSYPGITQDHVEAVKALGLDRPWARINKRMESCPACARPIPVGAIRCTHAECGAVLDEEKARKFFPHLYAGERQKPGPKPRLEEAA